MDKQVKKIADRVEDGHYNRKQENKPSDRITRKVPSYRMKDRNRMVVELSNGRNRNIQLDDIDNYLKYAKLSKYDKQLVKNAVEDWNKKSNTKQFFHISSNSKKLSLGGYMMKENTAFKGGDGVGSKTEEEKIKHYEELIYGMVKNKTT